MPSFRKLLGGIGDVGKVIAPFTSLIPGVGPLASAGIGAASGALGTLNDEDEERSIGSALKNALLSGGIAYGGSRLMGGEQMNSVAPAGPVNAGASIGQALKNVAGRVGGGIERAGNYLGDEKQGMMRQAMLMNALGAGANLYGASQEGREEDRQRRVRKSYAPAYGSLLKSLVQ